MEDHEILHTCSYPVLDGTFKVLDGYITVMPPSGNISFLNLPLYRLTSCGVTQTISLYYQWFSIFLFFGIWGRGRIMAQRGSCLCKNQNAKLNVTAFKTIVKMKFYIESNIVKRRNPDEYDILWADWTQLFESQI